MYLCQVLSSGVETDNLLDRMFDNMYPTTCNSGGTKWHYEQFPFCFLPPLCIDVVDEQKGNVGIDCSHASVSANLGARALKHNLILHAGLCIAASRSSPSCRLEASTHGFAYPEQP